MKVELGNLSKIKPYPQNPRINDHAVDAVATSIREFGFRQPIVVDEQGVITDVIITRWEQFTGRTSERVPRGADPA